MHKKTAWRNYGIMKIELLLRKISPTIQNDGLQKIIVMYRKDAKRFS
jgi:hypothetical protein